MDLKKIRVINKHNMSFMLEGDRPCASLGVWCSPMCLSVAFFIFPLFLDLVFKPVHYSLVVWFCICFTFVFSWTESLSSFDLQSNSQQIWPTHSYPLHFKFYSTGWLLRSWWTSSGDRSLAMNSSTNWRGNCWLSTKRSMMRRWSNFQTH